MSDAGVDLTYLCRSDETATGCGFVMIDPQGVPAITTALGANAKFSPEDVDSAHWTRPFKGSEERKARSTCNQANHSSKDTGSTWLILVLLAFFHTDVRAEDIGRTYSLENNFGISVPAGPQAASTPYCLQESVGWEEA